MSKTKQSGADGHEDLASICHEALHRESGWLRPQRGGSRPGAGRPPLEVTRDVRREVKLTPAEAAAHDAARGAQPWGEWIRDVAALAIALGPAAAVSGSDRD